MADFYQDMAGVAAELLAPTNAGGLGQGAVALTSITPGEKNPDAPWEPVVPTITTENLRGAAKGVSSNLVGVELGGTVIIATDREVITTVPTISYKAGDNLTIDGKSVRVIDVKNIPAAGITSAVKWIVR